MMKAAITFPGLPRRETTAWFWCGMLRSCMPKGLFQWFVRLHPTLIVSTFWADWRTAAGAERSFPADNGHNHLHQYQSSAHLAHHGLLGSQPQRILSGNALTFKTSVFRLFVCVCQRDSQPNLSLTSPSFSCGTLIQVTGSRPSPSFSLL